MSSQQIVQENNLLRLHLKNFNKELNVIIDRQALKPNNKPPINKNLNKPSSAKMRTVLEEIKINTKKMGLLKDELEKYQKRVDKISDGTYLVDLQYKIDDTQKILEEQKKNNKLIFLDQKKHGKNLENIDSLGMPENLAKGNEISSLLPGLSKKNQSLKEKNDMVLIQIEEIEKKNQANQDRYEKALQLAEAYKLFYNDKKRDQYEITQAKVEALEKNIQTIQKKNDKVLEVHKRMMEDLLKSLKEKDELIFAKERDLMISRQKIEEMMLTEKINKDSLMKILPPTPKNNIISQKKSVESLLDNEKLDSNRVWSKKEDSLKDIARQSNKEDIMKINDDSKQSNNNDNIEKNENNEIEISKPENKENEKNMEQSPSKTSVKSLKKTEEISGNHNQNDSKAENNKNLDLINENTTISNEKKEMNPIKNEDTEKKTFNLHQNDQKELKTFNFNKKNTNNTGINLNNKESPNLGKNSSNKFNFNNKLSQNDNIGMTNSNDQGTFKKERKFNVFNDDTKNANDFVDIPEIKSVENQDQKPNKNIESFDKDPLEKKITQTTTASKPKKIIADPYGEDTKKTDNFNSAYGEEETTNVNTKKLRMGTKKANEKVFDGLIHLNIFFF